MDDAKAERPERNDKRQATRYLKGAVLLLPRLARLLYRLMRDPRVPGTEKALVAAVLAYVATPIDIVPDFIPLAGQVDDLLAVALVLLHLISSAGEELVREHWTGPPDLIPWIHTTARLSRIFLPKRAAQALDSRFGRS